MSTPTLRFWSAIFKIKRPDQLLPQKGFTLIELLVVIAIIGILAALGTVSFTNAQSKARDAKRKSDISAISKALQLYYNDHNHFPCFSIPCSSIYGGIANISGVAGQISPSYTRTVPEDPVSKTACPGYLYSVSESGTQYSILTQLENTNDPQATKAKGAPYLAGGTSPDGYKTIIVSGASTCGNYVYNHWLNGF